MGYSLLCLLLGMFSVDVAETAECPLCGQSPGGFWLYHGGSQPGLFSQVRYRKSAVFWRLATRIGPCLEATETPGRRIYLK